LPIRRVRAHIDKVGEGPFDVDLTEPLCPGSALHNVSVLVETNSGCLRLDETSAGVLHVDHVATYELGTDEGSETHPGHAMTGFVDATVRSIDGQGSPIPMHLEFELTSGATTINIYGNYPDLCAPPEGG
jgi:hypothetical protein